MNTARDLMWNENVVVANNQSTNSKFFLTLCDWLFTTFSFHIKSRALVRVEHVDSKTYKYAFLFLGRIFRPMFLYFHT